MIAGPDVKGSANLAEVVEADNPLRFGFVACEKRAAQRDEQHGRTETAEEVSTGKGAFGLVHKSPCGRFALSAAIMASFEVWIKAEDYQDRSGFRVIDSD